MVHPTAPLPPTVVLATSQRDQVQTQRIRVVVPSALRNPAQLSEIDGEEAKRHLGDCRRGEAGVARPVAEHGVDEQLREVG